MRFKRSALTVKQILGRIESDELDLQPNFQRGEVWAEPKKQRLVDSILRGWYIPPVHVVDVGGNRKEVLDGQQRLAALRDFHGAVFPFDGTIQPPNPKFGAIHGLLYPELPKAWRDKFDLFKLTIFSLTDYATAEPGELFFRLNQPTTLTAAEQRNAFYGRARDQVKKWVAQFERGGVGKEVIGFSNARMAYDDTLARVALTVENGTLSTKVRALELVDVYRSPEGFSAETDAVVRKAVEDFCKASATFNPGLHFNKATLYSWLVFLVRARNRQVNLPLEQTLPQTIGKYVSHFSESLRAIYVADGSQKALFEESGDQRLLLFFENRATSRVADVSSVIIRDLILWLYFYSYVQDLSKELKERLTRVFHRDFGLCRSIYKAASNSSPFDEDALEYFAEERNWGKLR
jgi:hypothetical protein